VFIRTPRDNAPQSLHSTYMLSPINTSCGSSYRCRRTQQRTRRRMAQLS
jgi:hypothetical protein